MDKDILVSDVSINTLAVEVKVMRIGNRQVTQSVFKQLPQKDLIDERGNIEGVPWGWVNYHPDCAEYTRGYPHTHIVFQLGNKLYRAWVIESYLLPHIKDPITGETTYAFLKEQVELSALDLVRFKIIAGWVPEETNITIAYNHVIRIPIEGKKVDVTLVSRDPEKYALCGSSDQKAAAIAELWLQLKRNLGTTNSLEVHEHTLYQRVVDRVHALDAYIDAYDASYKRLKQLEQLYIAV